MHRTQRLQQYDDDGDSSSSSSSSSSSTQPIDDSDGYILDEDYVDHDEEVIINESLQEVMAELDKESSAVDTNSLPVDKYKDIEPTIDNVQPCIGTSNSSLWEQCMEENNRIKQEVFLGTCKKKKPSILDIFDLFYGINSNIYRCFKTYLGWDYPLFMRFIVTFAVHNSIKLDW